ncbi:MAG: CRISPR-associated endonuclease Cas3'', partial [bacterium]|nr:CRISPR-associated endonuclease Cas3'' [bacterium]
MTDRSQQFAHSLPERPESEWQLIEAHLTAVAEKARDNAEPFGAGDWAYLAGLWHDLGKYSDEFQTYIRSAMEASAETQRGRVDHSTAGAQHAASQYPGLFGKVLANTIAGHHAGLLDAIGDGSSLEDRLQKAISDWSIAPREIVAVLPDLKLPLGKLSSDDARGMRASLFIRMLFSALVDADFLDTEAFLDPSRSAQRPQYPAIAVIRTRLVRFLDSLQGESRDSPVNAARRAVLAACLDAANLAPGIFSLTVPTGGGKTLSSLAFALKHASEHGLRRVIYAVPFTSIIEQNAGVFRRALGGDAVLEHHSNIDPILETTASRLAAENWNAPLIVTTNVQFFESFFASRTSANRKLHSVAGSVIILDEAQALPVQFLHACLALLRELVASYQCTVVLCTATQPAIEWREEFPIGLPRARPIIQQPLELFQVLKRVDIEQRGPLTDDDLVANLREHDQVLCIVNTRRHAAVIFDKLGRQEGNLHLSALMCPAHRAAELNEIRTRLSQSSTCRVISTQLVEAGVDIDFPVVYRASAGLDSLLRPLDSPPASCRPSCTSSASGRCSS